MWYVRTSVPVCLTLSLSVCRGITLTCLHASPSDFTWHLILIPGRFSHAFRPTILFLTSSITYLFIASYSLRHALFFITSISLVPFPSASLPASNWYKLSELIVCFSVFMLYVAWKRGLLRKCARFVPFCSIEKPSFKSLVCFGS